tara:strand:+ start:10867 stop:12456 length:1590 start_codon:yes stop_codon:yes gene_type:complete
MSSDALATYNDGHSYCFSCMKYTPSTEGQDMGAAVIEFTDRNTAESIGSISTYSSYPMSSRGINKETIDYFNVKMSVNEDGSPEAHFYPYTHKGKIIAYKKRTLPKNFSTVGKFNNVELFGQSQASASGGQKLIITEGEIDCLAVAQSMYEKYNKYYSVVSIPSASQTKSILENRDFVRKYKEVVLMFDQDDAGAKAVEQAAKIIGIDKVKVASFNFKDPSELYVAEGKEGVLNAVWNASSYNPAGILTGESIWSHFKDRQNAQSVPYPDCLNGLNEKLGGMRHGEITLFTSGTGSGKSTVIKEIVLDILKRTDDKVGLISLEESVGDTAEKFIAMQLQRPLQGEHPLSDEELRDGFNSVFGDERLVLLDHQGSVSDASLLDKIEYMALMGCKYLVLDHITIAVSEGAAGLTGNEAVDKVMSDLLKIVKKHNVWLGLVSHLRKAMGGKSFEEGHLASIDDIKGSGSIKQISFDIIAFARNVVAESPIERNTIKLRVLKARFTGFTGDCGTSVYNPKTTRLSVGGQFDYT